jgi:hypothetical protein
MDIDALASEFGGIPTTDDKGRSEPIGIDVHGLAAEFGGKETAKEVSKIPDNVRRVYIVAPPISGDTDVGEQPKVTQAGGANPRDSAISEGIKNLPSNVGSAIAEKFSEGKQIAGEGLEDIQSGKPYKGAAKIGVGALAAVTSPVTGTVQETIEKPITELTGSPDIGSRAGFIATSAIPVAPGTSAVTKAIPKNKALVTLIESIEPENLPKVVSKMRENPRLTPTDLSPKVLQDVQHLLVTDGPHINYLSDQVKASTEGAKGAVSSAMDTSLGSTVNAVDKLKELKQNIRDVGAKEINPIITAKPHTDITSVIHDIDKEIGAPALKAFREGTNSPFIDNTKRALYELRNKLRGNWPDRDQMFAYTDQLHRTQSELRGTAETLKNSADGWARLTGSKLLEFREKLKDTVGKDYKEALGKYKDEIDIEKAFNHGHDAILTNSKAIENRPEFFKEWVKNASPEELHAAREGARIAVDTQINGFKGAARKGTDIGQVEFNKQRLEALFGKDEANKLFTKLEDERAIADRNTKLIQGSQTAMRSASKAAFELPTKTEVGKTLLPAAIVEGSNMLAGGIGGVGTAAYLGLKGIASAKDRIKLALAKEHNAQYAKMALPTEGPSREALIQSLSNAIPGPKQSIVRRGVHTLSRLVQP